MSLLRIEGLAKCYGAIAALQGATVDIAAGEVVALMGENGAGKSTLIKILAGAVAPDAGVIALDGERTTIDNPRAAHRLGLRFIHQELNDVARLSVAENIFLGRRYPTRLGGLIDWRRLFVTARGALDGLGLAHVGATAIMARLAVGDRMLVKIAAAFLEDAAAPARLIVMDEPTAALTGEESERLFRLIVALKARRCGVLYVSHRIDEVLRIADRIVVLRDGATTATLDAQSATKTALIEAMTGRAGIGGGAAPSAARQARVALSVRDLEAGELKDIAFEVREGEILGLAGLADAGQDRLLKALMGRRRQGEITLAGAELSARNPAEAWREGLAYVPRERRSEGLLLGEDVTRNVALPHLFWLRRLGAFLDRRRERRVVGEAARRVRLKSAGLAQRVRTLSGGNQQKAMFARAILGAPRALLLDEPTRGVDVGAKFDIHELLRELAAGGAAILVHSSDHEELIAVCSRIAVLREGRIAVIVPVAGLTPRRLLALCYGEAA